MQETFSTFEWAVYAIIAVNVLLSWRAFSDMGLFHKLKFHVGEILLRKDYQRMLTAAFIHVNLTHLLFNMIAFWSFGLMLQHFIELWQFLVLYFVSLFTGNFLPLYFHKDNPEYCAVGASGAVSGVVFASILFYPFGEIIFIFLPFLPIPSWIFGILYLLYTVYGIDKQSDNIGHEAHLGGALAGLFLAIGFRLDLAIEHWWLVIILTVLPVFLLVVILKRKYH